ncbi:MAG: winged helix-turn-helix domain-containing protein, partial [Micromonosporaceae bacterium]|nr:winged helix-turn-helix domain-containing protein [Micromonosporaceae bacterium]
MNYRILGPVEVERDGAAISIEAPRQRAVLVALLLEANHVVSVDRLALQLWGESPPASARSTIQSLILRLRKTIIPSWTPQDQSVLITRRPGYLLSVDPGQLDLDEFHRLIRHGRQSLTAGNPEVATVQLRQALAMWRGDPFEDTAAVRLRE